jgi:hypothetical protein
MKNPRSQNCTDCGYPLLAGDRSASLDDYSIVLGATLAISYDREQCSHLI